MVKIMVSEYRIDECKKKINENKSNPYKLIYMWIKQDVISLQEFTILMEFVQFKYVSVN
jgi:hypothetical protein